MVATKCIICGKSFLIYPYRIKTVKFCSFACNMADKHIRFGEKIKEVNRNRFTGNKLREGLVAWNKGKKLHYEVWNKGKKKLQIAWNKGKTKENDNSVKNISKTLLGKPQLWQRGEKHWNWQGGISEKNHLFRNSVEYKMWRRGVFLRDRFSCIICGYRSKKQKDIRADHIKPFSLFPELRLDISNGRTLCLPCDLKHGWNYSRDGVKKMKSNK